ncbi:Hsp70-Hsp90 organizing protein [Acrasis kona]|uniref:Hsp70-Hsp90 organizing protein n=1 Tax=Acrasis kona TaxID=1008807 RepID=A0AAW2ZIL8_9EUKA
MSADEYKQKGNTALQQGDKQGAIDNYTKGLEIDPTNYLLLTNRAAVYLQLQKFNEAYEDSTKAVTAKPDFSKSLLRQGQALFGLNRLEESIAALEKAAKIEPGNAAITKQLQDVKNKLDDEESKANPLANMFNGPDFWSKITTNPELRPYLSEPDFMQKVQEIQKNPSKMNEHMKDQRIMKLFMSLLNMQGFGDPTPSPSEPKKTETKTETKKQAEPEPEEINVDEVEVSANEKEAAEEKEKGNQLFKQKNFDGALVHYNKAAELDPKNLTYRLNRAAVLIEQSKYDDAVKECQEAVDYGRSNRADFKLIGRALERMGNAYMRKKDYANAVKSYADSLTEEKSREVIKKKQQAEQLLSKQREEEYKSPEKAEEARLRGNELFKQQKFPEAMKEYNEAIKRDATKANLYFNRCSCYLKLGEPNYALKDAEKCLEIDPKYVKAYARKAQCHTMRKEYHKSIDCYNTGLELDADNAEMKDGLLRVKSIVQQKSGTRDEDRIRIASQDPEIAMIMNDPVMKQVLTDFSENPREAQRHLKDPGVLAKIEKLIAAGIIQTG